MKTHLGLLALCLSATACANTSSPVMPDTESRPLAAHASGVELRLVDAWNTPLPTYSHNGGIFIEGQQGRRYNAQLINNTGRRIEVVVTVDGRDVLNGKPGDFSNRGYIVEAYGQVSIEGFRKSLSDVAAFRFTTPSDSYSARMGTAQNVGVIGAAIFYERAPVAIAPPPVWRPEPYDAVEDEARAAAPEATASRGPGQQRKGMGERMPARRRRKAGNLGTRYGESTRSPVVETGFEREASSPAEVLAVYYDNREGLIARGIVPNRPPVATAPQPFPNAPRFAPAPR